MRLSEFIHSDKNTPESNLITALELIRNRYKDSKTSPKLTTQSLINMVLNTDRTFNYDALIKAYKSNPAVKNLIKSFNKDYVELQSLDDSNSVEGEEEFGDGAKGPTGTVGDMAKRAAAKRDSSIF